MTGSQESVELLQQYLDQTGDVQTVTWLAVKALPGDVALTNEAVQVNKLLLNAVLLFKLCCWICGSHLLKSCMFWVSEMFIY